MFQEDKETVISAEKLSTLPFSDGKRQLKTNSAKNFPASSRRELHGEESGFQADLYCMSGAQFSQGKPLAGRWSKYYGSDSCPHITVKVDELPSPKLPKVPC